jgi:acetoacetate decarboxylase
MKISDIRNNAFAVPISSPAYAKAPYHFVNREFFIITYRTDLKKLQAVVPEPLTVTEPLVSFEFIRMPDSSGFGNYTESGQVIHVLGPDGKPGTYTHMMYLDDEAPIAAGREIWGFPKKLASPKLQVELDALVGTLDYGSIRVATGTMGYKYTELDIAAEERKVSNTPGYLLKIIPHVDSTPRICELVRYYCKNVKMHGAWSGPARLQLFEHALAPMADLPILEIVSAKHTLCDMTLDVGEVVFDYLK